jgi:hypothetical protein
MMTTIEPFVYQHLIKAGVLPKVKTIIVGENAPNPGTYFYRSWNVNLPPSVKISTNPFLKNVAEAFGLNLQKNNPSTNNPWTEVEILDEIVLKKGVLVIDSHKNGVYSPQSSNRHLVTVIDNDIKLINPNKIIFIHIGANTRTIEDLIKSDSQYYIPKIALDYIKFRFCHVFPNRPREVSAFKDSINFLIKNKLL